MLPAGGSRMEWTLRLVGTEMDGQSRSFDVMEISRPDDLSDFANLGLTLAEAKRLSQLHYAFKTLTYTMINRRHYCRG